MIATIQSSYRFVSGGALNTFLVGAATDIPTAAALAAKTSLLESEILDFTINGDDVECRIETDYSIIGSAFISQSYLEKYLDIDGHFKTMGTSAFAFASALNEVDFNGLTSMPGIGFRECTSLSMISLPSLLNLAVQNFLNQDNTTVILENLVNMGADELNNLCFTQSDNILLACPVFFETNNAGNPDGDIADLESRGGEAYYGDIAAQPNAISDLATTFVGETIMNIDWSAPTNVPIKEFNIYLDDALHDTTADLEYSFTGLTGSQTYKVVVKSVSGFLVESNDSNILNILMDGKDIRLGMISRYKFEDNVLDDVGSNDGTDTDLTYAVGGVGKSGVFNGTSTRVDCGTGLNTIFESDFTMSLLINPDDISGGQALLDTDGTGGVRGFIFRLNDDVVQMISVSGGVQTTSSNAIITASSLQHVLLTWDSSTPANSKIYIDGVDETSTVTGSNTGMLGLTHPFRIGVNGRGLDSHYDGLIDEPIVWNRILPQGEITDLATAQLAGTDIDP